MGRLVCEYCEDPATAAVATRDIVLSFSSGRTWRVPDLIVHFVEEHGWKPPASFVGDVMESRIGKLAYSSNGSPPAPLGYLSGVLDAGSVPPSFLIRLKLIIDEAMKVTEPV